MIAPTWHPSLWSLIGSCVMYALFVSPFVAAPLTVVHRIVRGSW